MYTPNWYNKRAARRVLSWKTEKGQDVSINHIVSELAVLKGSVLEIGPGSGNLLKYLPAGIQYTCIEPNTHLHNAIRAEAARCGFSGIKIIADSAERMSFESNIFDAVVSVRSLCSMDTLVVLEQIRCVLKPGGKFIFVEHVAAPKGTTLWFTQKIISKPHKLLRGGCDPSKDIELYIRKAGFSSVNIEHFEVDRDFAKSRIAGVAVK